MLFKVILVSFLTLIDARRQRRYLVYPDGGPARTQFIIGLGVPVDLKEASVTVGTVIKFQYDLPTNSSEYTSRIYGFANTVSRDMDGEGEDNEEKNDVEDAKGIDSNVLEEDLDDGNNTLVDITFDNRRKRSLVYTEGGILNDNGVEGKELSLEEAIRRQEAIDQNNLEDEDPQRMNRWDFYKIIEHMVESAAKVSRFYISFYPKAVWKRLLSNKPAFVGYGYSGRPCLLRTICEAAEVPFTHENGLLAEIGHILFTPSTTKDSLSHHTDNEYHAAERLGREAEVSCETLFPECEGSILDTFTEVGVDTLHKFGLF